MSGAQDQRLVADLLVDRLRAWGVTRLFGYPGDGNNGLMGALRRAGEPVLVQARHEENAALMAVGHAKYTGEVGVMTSTQSPGAVHLLNGLHDAKLDLPSLVKDVAAQFVQTVVSPAQATMVLDRAFRTALATRSSCVVVVPHDVQTAPTPPDTGETTHGVAPTARRLVPARVVRT